MQREQKGSHAGANRDAAHRQLVSSMGKSLPSLHWNTIAEEQSQHKKTDIKVLKEMKLMLEVKMALVLDMIVK